MCAKSYYRSFLCQIMLCIIAFDCKKICHIKTNQQRWSRGHRARGQGQGHKKNPRPGPRTAFLRTDTIEANDRNARGQGQGPRTQAPVFSKKKVFSKIFQAISKNKKKRSSHKFFKRSPQKTFSKKFFKRSTKFYQFKK